MYDVTVCVFWNQVCQLLGNKVLQRSRIIGLPQANVLHKAASRT
uniref:Uncharacterized protein n=1 Tax=Arundo donax TaxID=35708 RepID=A0A0A9MTH1_ARUDO